MTSPTVQVGHRDRAFHHPQRVGGDQAVGLRVAQQLDQVLAGGRLAGQHRADAVEPGTALGWAFGRWVATVVLGHGLRASALWQRGKSSAAAVGSGEPPPPASVRAIQRFGVGILDAESRRGSRAPAAPCTRPRASSLVVPAEQVQGAVDGEVGVVGEQRLLLFARLAGTTGAHSTRSPSSGILTPLGSFTSAARPGSSGRWSRSPCRGNAG